jgi:hypothetical protein
VSEEQIPEGAPGPKKAPPVALVGAGVAIAASLVAIFVATNNSQNDEANAPATIVGTEPAPDEMAQIQFGANGQTTAPTPPVTPDPNAPTASADGSLAYADESISFSAAFPPGPADDPVLTYLRTDAESYFRKLKANAVTDAADRKQNGAPAMPWELQIEWKYVAKAGGIVSLVGTAYEFTGGAHGMTFTDTHIARAATGEQLSLETMLNPGITPSPAITIAVCEALKAEKVKRMGSPTVYDEPIVCAGANTNIKIEEAKFALAPSSEPDRFGGLFVYYEPYAVGAYAEGSYQLAVPQEVFAEDMRPEFRKLFSGKLAGTP